MRNINTKGNRGYFYQWDTGQSIVAEGFQNLSEAHFAHKGDNLALVVKPIEKDGHYEASVPNILLQSDERIYVYLIYKKEDGTETRASAEFTVIKRPKPESYVYTETEIATFAALEERMDKLEATVSVEGVAKAVEEYLTANPPQAGATAEEAAQIQKNSEDIENLQADKLDADKLPEAVNEALAQAKASGEFKGEPGKDGEDYVLTEDDKREIAEQAAELVEVPEGGGSAEAVLYTEQTLTEEQKAQARKNIGVGSGENVDLDTTLTQSGKAADAKATGDAVNQLSEEIGEHTVALANMSVEGFQRVGGYENVKDGTDRHENKLAFVEGWDSALNKAIIGEKTLAGFNCYVWQVKSGETYRIRTWCGDTLYAGYLVNETNHIIQELPTKHLPAAADNYEFEITIPSGATRMYVNETASQSSAFSIEKANMAVPTFKNLSDHLLGKKLACVGDSITEATNPDGGYFINYAELAAARHNMSVYKDGKGGSTMANIESNIPPFSAERYLNVPADYDILTIWFGWNDAAYASVGTAEDTDDTTFYGAYKKVLEYFITTYPTKKIGLIVPYGNASVEPFREAVRNLSEMYGVPCLNLADGKQCSLLWGTANAAQEARRAALTYDGTHPNQTGHEYLSTMYEAFIKRL